MYASQNGKQKQIIHINYSFKVNELTKQHPEFPKNTFEIYSGDDSFFVYTTQKDIMIEWIQILNKLKNKFEEFENQKNGERKETYSYIVPVT